MADNPTNALTNQEVVKQGNNEYRRTIQHLPAFYRTDSNTRFLSSTLDPLIQKGDKSKTRTVEKSNSRKDKTSKRGKVETSKSRHAKQ